MDLRAGALGGATGTLAMSGLNKALSEFGLVYETVPMQIVDRMAEVGLIEDWSPAAKRTVSSAAHLGYGTTAGVVLGALRREQGEPTTELAVGIALRLLAWGPGGACGCHFSASTMHPGHNAHPKYACPCWVTRCSEPPGV